MDNSKSFLMYFAQAVEQYRADRHTSIQELSSTKRQSWLRWLGQQMIPNIGTLLMVVVLLLTIPSLAAPLVAPSATSTSTISYQGRLTDSGGTPVTGMQTIEFRIYDVPTGGVPLGKSFGPGPILLLFLMDCSM